MCKIASNEPSCSEIGSVVFAVGDDKNKKGKGKKGKRREGKVQKVTKLLLYFHVFVQKPRLFPPCQISVKSVHYVVNRFLPKFCTEGGIRDVIMCANLGVDKLRGLNILDYGKLKFWHLLLKGLVTLTIVLHSDLPEYPTS